MGHRSMRRKAISIANHSSEKIVLGVYQNLISSHNSFCSCDYCQILRVYVDRKRALSRFKRIDYEFYNIHPFDLGGDFGVDRTFYTEVERRKEEIKALKCKKDALKRSAISNIKI